MPWVIDREIQVSSGHVYNSICGFVMLFDVLFNLRPIGHISNVQSSKHSQSIWNSSSFSFFCLLFPSQVLLIGYSKCALSTNTKGLARRPLQQWERPRWTMERGKSIRGTSSTPDSKAHLCLLPFRDSKGIQFSWKIADEPPTPPQNVYFYYLMIPLVIQRNRKAK